MGLRPTLHQLRALTIVAEEGSVTRAAARLHVTQPTLSIQLRQLAEAIGEPLIETVGRKLHLTDAGLEVLSAATAVDEQLLSLDARLAARRNVHEGRLRVSIVSTAEYFMPRLLGLFHQQYPGIEIVLRVLNRAQVLVRLEENADDLYMMTRPPDDAGVRAERMGRNPLVVVAATDHPWVTRRRIPARELESQPFIVRETGSGTRLWSDQWLGTRAIALRTTMELGSNEAIKQAVRGGFGLAILSAHCLVLELEQRVIRVLDVAGFPIPSAWYLVTRSGRLLSPVGEAFRRFLKRTIPDTVQGIERARAHGVRAPAATRHR